MSDQLPLFLVDDDHLDVDDARDEHYPCDGFGCPRCDVVDWAKQLDEAVARRVLRRRSLFRF